MLTQSRPHYTNAWPRSSWPWFLLWVFLLLSHSQVTLPVLKLQIYRSKWPTGQDLGILLLPEITCFESSPSWEFPYVVPLSAVCGWPSYLVSHSLGFCLFRVSDQPVNHLSVLSDVPQPACTSALTAPGSVASALQPDRYLSASQAAAKEGFRSVLDSS